MALPRKLTAAEKPVFLSAFPLLDVDFTIVTGEPSGVYNCISWTVGVTNFWHWPGSNLTDFDNFYNQFGLTRKTKGHVAAWGLANNSMTHGCISGPTHGPCWESKCGSLARIQHCLNELNGPSYGHVIAYYATKFKIIIPKYLKLYMKRIRRFTPDDLKQIKELRAPIPRSVVTSFETKFKAWKKTWFSPELAFNSNPYSRAGTREFRELVGMGNGIVPLLAEKLMDESNFMALSAFEQLAGKKWTLRIDSKDEKVLEGEQGRAFRTVKNYLESSK
ncbi:MAG TPA: hypothetical protein VGO58_00125 [Chitinophagaceae bacterium]|jgi:hypothetical protein|nr:hypothetical protein [Chitinophagaceae bacterium]